MTVRLGLQRQSDMLLRMLELERDDCESALLPDYSPDGVELSLIRWSLSLAPVEGLLYWKTASGTLSEFALNAGK